MTVMSLYVPSILQRAAVRRLTKAASIGLAALSFPVGLAGQSRTAAVDFELNVANNHLWRGIEVSDGCVTTTSLSLHDPKNHVRFGLWGGTNTSGDYKEFNYFAEFKTGGWTLAFWDTYNFSPGATYNNREFFNYSARTTGRFLDAQLAYQFGPRFPLRLLWSTIVFGRDRNAANTANKYSTFVYAEYPLYRHDGWTLSAGCGGTFALQKGGDRSTFYSQRPGVIHVQLHAARLLPLTPRYSLPVHVTAVWNPEGNRAFLQVGAQLLRF